MTTAREIIARAADGKWPFQGYAPGRYISRCIVCEGCFEGDKRAYHCPTCALIDAGFRIVGPGEVDKETVEKCAEVAWNATISTRNHPHDAFRDEPIIHREIIATAIRALAEEKRP